MAKLHVVSGFKLGILSFITFLLTLAPIDQAHSLEEVVQLTIARQTILKVRIDGARQSEVLIHRPARSPVPIDFNVSGGGPKKTLASEASILANINERKTDSGLALIQFDNKIYLVDWQGHVYETPFIKESIINQVSNWQGFLAQHHGEIYSVLNLQTANHSPFLKVTNLQSGVEKTYELTRPIEIQPAKP
jgi:hypothetical protein